MVKILTSVFHFRAFLLQFLINQKIRDPAPGCPLLPAVFFFVSFFFSCRSLYAPLSQHALRLVERGERAGRVTQQAPRRRSGLSTPWSPPWWPPSRLRAELSVVCGGSEICFVP